jgi:hypothetical protein
VMMSPVQRLQLGGGFHFRNMSVPHAGTGNSESAGTARQGACIDGRLVVLVV